MTAQIGLNIGTYSIKLVRADLKSKSVKLISRGEIRTPASINSEAEKDKNALIEAIKKLIAEVKIDTKNVVLGSDVATGLNSGSGPGIDSMISGTRAIISGNCLTYSSTHGRKTSIFSIEFTISIGALVQGK